MNKLSFDKYFFVKKRKQKYPRNKFFSYTNKNRADKNFSFKDFRNSTSYNTQFTRSIFYGTYFEKVTMKYCGFNGANFESITFINCNFKNSRFKGASFKNCYFKNCKMNNTNLQNTKFINTFFQGTGLKKARRVPKDFETKDVPNLLHQKFYQTLKNQRYNKILLKALTESNVNRLLVSYTENEILLGLSELNEKDLKFINFSYMTKFIDKNKEV